eukprot:scaffold31461_cov34-Prasinocladus_malaysianus.AAC.1
MAKTLLTQLAPECKLKAQTAMHAEAHPKGGNGYTKRWKHTAGKHKWLHDHRHAINPHAILYAAITSSWDVKKTVHM